MPPVAASADHFWWASHANHPTHPNKEAPRCLPCHHKPPEDTSRAPFQAPIGCPCTPQVLCDTDPNHRVYNRCEAVHGGLGCRPCALKMFTVGWALGRVP